MDINQQLQPIVATLINDLKGSIEKELHDQITEQIIEKLASQEIKDVVEGIVEQRLRDRIAEYDVNTITKTKLDQKISELIANLSNVLHKNANQQVESKLDHMINQVDFQNIIASVAESRIQNLVNTGSFPSHSISHNSINFKDLVLSGDSIKGGIIEEFGSTGIEDRATFVQLTLMDHACAFEGPIYAPEMKIKGNLTIEGSLLALGDIATDTPVFIKLVNETSTAVKQSLNDEIFTKFSDNVFERIRISGLDLDRITQGGKEVISGNRLGYNLTDSNLQKLGIVKDLQTLGENFLCKTLYVTDAGRVGINTMDPSSVFSLWDEEVEINISKRENDTGYINTPRNQKLIISSNNKDNLTLETDGSVSVTNLSIGKIPMSSANYVPNYNGKLGQIVWNEVPSHGSPIGWVCLGATRWSKFGTVE